MHPNTAFHIHDHDIMLHWLSEIGFGALFAATPDGLRVAHVPVLVESQDTLLFHLARGNAMAKWLDKGQALFVVNGPDAYMSPEWYGVDDQVPTWNYIAIEAEGRVEKLDSALLPELIDKTSAHYEGRLTDHIPWTRDKMDPQRFDKMVRSIVGFRLTIAALRGTNKMGQNKPQTARDAAASMLEARGHKAVALMMRGDGT